MEERLPLEYAALGLLMRGPRHGYQLHSDFERYLGAIWRCGRSQFYAALKMLGPGADAPGARRYRIPA